jgi:hypothetical protein
MPGQLRTLCGTFVQAVPRFLFFSRSDHWFTRAVWRRFFLICHRPAVWTEIDPCPPCSDRQMQASRLWLATRGDLFCLSRRIKILGQDAQSSYASDSSCHFKTTHDHRVKVTLLSFCRCSWLRACNDDCKPAQVGTHNVTLRRQDQCLSRQVWPTLEDSYKRNLPLSMVKITKDLRVA